MKQLKLTLLLTMLMCLFGDNALAYDMYRDGIFYNLFESTSTAEVTYASYRVYDDGTVWVTSSRNYIPESIEYNGKNMLLNQLGVMLMMAIKI